MFSRSIYIIFYPYILFVFLLAIINNQTELLGLFFLKVICSLENNYSSFKKELSLCQGTDRNLMPDYGNPGDIVTWATEQWIKEAMQCTFNKWNDIHLTMLADSDGTNREL